MCSDESLLIPAGFISVWSLHTHTVKPALGSGDLKQTAFVRVASDTEVFVRWFYLMLQ